MMGWWQERKQRRCTHSWIPDGRHPNIRGANGVHTEYDLYCPKCKATRERVPEQLFLYIMNNKRGEDK